MISVYCKHRCISELPIDFHQPFVEYVHPLEYDFGVRVGTVYSVLGIIGRKSTLWLYVFSTESEGVRVLPAVLFGFLSTEVSPGMHLRMSKSSTVAFEILPQALVDVDNWFERYIDGEDIVLKIVKSEIQQLKEGSERPIKGDGGN